MTIGEVRGWGVGQRRDADLPRPAKVQLGAKLKVEIVVPAGEADAVMERLSDALRTSGLGPAKMFAFSVEGALHTRSGARDHEALAWRFEAGS